MSSAEPTPIAGPRIRRAAIPPEVDLLARGDPGDDTVTRLAARQFKRRYPDWDRYGLSAYYVQTEADLDDLAGTQLERFARIDVYRIGDLIKAGFDVVPTFRTPHVTIAFRDDLNQRIADLARSRLTTRANPYHERSIARPTRRRNR